MMQLRRRVWEERRGPRGRMEGKACRCGAGGGVLVILAVLVLTLALILQGAGAGAEAAAARASPCRFRVLGGGGGRQWALSFSPPPGARRAARAWRGGASRASSRICSMATTAQEVRKEGAWGVIAAPCFEPSRRDVSVGRSAGPPEVVVERGGFNESDRTYIVHSRRLSPTTRSC